MSRKRLATRLHRFPPWASVSSFVRCRLDQIISSSPHQHGPPHARRCSTAWQARYWVLRALEIPGRRAGEESLLLARHLLRGAGERGQTQPPPSPAHRESGRMEHTWGEQDKGREKRWPGDRLRKMEGTQRTGPLAGPSSQLQRAVSPSAVGGGNSRPAAYTRFSV